jgi:hypothetical protein
MRDRLESDIKAGGELATRRGADLTARLEILKSASSGRKVGAYRSKRPLVLGVEASVLSYSARTAALRAASSATSRKSAPPRSRS